MKRSLVFTFFFVTFMGLLASVSTWLGYLYQYSLISPILPIPWPTITIALWFGSMSYLLGESISQKTGFFGLKKIGAVYLGWVSIITSLSIWIIPMLLWPTAQFIMVPIIGTSYSVWIIPLTITIMFGLSIVLSIIAILNTTRHPQVVPFHLPNSQRANPLKIIQLSDIHLNGLRSANWVKKLVNQINSLSPDVIVFTGDLIDTQKKYLHPHIKEFQKLNAPTKLAISGNHDFYAGYSMYNEILKDISFINIDGESFELTHDNHTYYFYGIPDDVATQFKQSIPSVDSLIQKNASPLTTSILLSHRPNHFQKYSQLGINLQLSGHTHAGQLPPWRFLVRLTTSFVYGAYSIGNASLYVSKGTGTWGPPMRLFGRSEMTEIYL